MEEKECPKDALIREILEELGCCIDVKEKLGEMEYDYPDFKLKMDLYLCHIKEGCSPKALEHNQIRWIAPEEMESLDWLEADYKILPVIQKQLLYP